MMTILIISLVVAAVVALALWRLDWAIGLVILLLPFYTIRFTLSGLPFTLLEVALLALAAVFFYRYRLYRLSFLKQAINRVPFKLPLIIFLAAATLGVIVAPDIWEALGAWRAYFIEALVFFFIFANVVRRKQEQVTVLWALGAAALLVAIYAIVQNYTGVNIPEPWAGVAQRRVTAWYGYPVAVALFLAPVTALFTSLLLLRQAIIPRFFSLAIVITGLLAIYFTASRGAIMAWLAAVFFLGVLPASATGFSQKASRWWRAVLLVGVIICLGLAFLAPGISERFVSVWQGQDNSTNVRLVMWQGTWRLIQENWLLGAGLSGFPSLYDHYREARHTELLLYPHNIILNFWVEIGLAGLIAFVWLMINFFRKMRTGWRTGGRGAPIIIAAAAAMIACLIQGLIDVPYFKNDLSLLFWIIIGLGVSGFEISAASKNTKNVQPGIDRKVNMRYNGITKL